MYKIDQNKLIEASRFVRFHALRMSTIAGSGHPTSSLSAADLMTALFATEFRYDFKHPDYPGNDRLIFSKGHATPLYYALFALAGAIKVESLDTYRKFGSILEGHPTPRFPFAEAATGSLGQGLSIGVGMAINGKYADHIYNRTIVLMGDGEMAEGSVWEGVQIANHYRLDNLICILDVNRLGQSDPTMVGYDLVTYKRRLESFGWATTVIDGHNFGEILASYEGIGKTSGRPYMIIAKTIKGKGVASLEDKNGWHGKTLKKEEFEKVGKELGNFDPKIRIDVSMPPSHSLKLLKLPKSLKEMNYHLGDAIATRQAYGTGLVRIGEKYPEVVVLDCDVKNSTYAETFKAQFPDRFFEMFIAEQNMAGVALGLAKRGKIPFVSSFASFLTRAFDQIRMSALSCGNIKFCGSHAGVSIGEDGPSQMGLEDIAMFRSVFGSTVVYPADSVAMEKLVEEVAKRKGLCYIRATRPTTPVIYENEEMFPIGGSKVHRSSHKAPKTPKPTKPTKKVLIIAAGITLFEALKAQEELTTLGIEATVLDCYSIKPIDEKTIKRLSVESGVVITVEDHWFDGGLGDAVLNCLASTPGVEVSKLAVSLMPRSGKPSELMAYVGIDKDAIVKKAKEVAYGPSRAHSTSSV